MLTDVNMRKIFQIFDAFEGVAVVLYVSIIFFDLNVGYLCIFVPKMSVFNLCKFHIIVNVFLLMNFPRVIFLL